ncbi:Carboxylesterase family [Popillia japonica]|uniref:Carboxylesterase family n=1 Tax=Popillia japonica TaxID=7064 RepID=A0AAW1MLZ6_POPJA
MSDCVVNTFYGKLRGKTLLDIKGSVFYGFQGIPYAKPPLGNLRFKAPQPLDKWADIRDATKEASECYQRHMVFQTIIGSEDCLYLNVYSECYQRHMVFQTIIGSEDCLYLNVYIPQLPGDEVSLKPVMVWLHGGAFTGGSGNKEPYGPEFLITEDVVIVTLNYRVGILGFLSLEDPKLGVPGNAGLKDVVFALKWVQQNIENFSGDPNNVTMFGGSAGAVAAHLLMLSPLVKGCRSGLFHKIIAQSGCALTHWAITESSTGRLCELLNFITENPKEILQFLQKLPVEKLYQGQEMLQNEFGVSRNRPIGPVIEKPHAGAFLTEDPHKILTEGNYYKVPIILGYNNREGIFFDMVGNRMKRNTMVVDFETVVPTRFKFERGSEKSEEVARKIKEFYYGNEEVAVDNKDIYYRLETDIVFLRDIYETIRLHLKVADTPLYLYRFSIDAKLNFFKAVGRLTAAGAAHGDELGYQFKTFLTPGDVNWQTIEGKTVYDVNWQTIEGKTVYRMIKLWTNFAKTGNPTPDIADEVVDVIWSPVTVNEMNFLDWGKFDSETNTSDNEHFKTDVNPDFDRIQFWKQLYEEYGHRRD